MEHNLRDKDSFTNKEYEDMVVKMLSDTSQLADTIRILEKILEHKTRESSISVQDAVWRYVMEQYS